MWQRMQTVFLAIVVISMFLMIFFPIWVGADGDTTIKFYPMYLMRGEADVYHPYTWVSILAIASVTIGLIEITRFKNRLLQIKLGALNSLLMAGCMVTAILLARNLQNSYPGSFGFSLFLPAVGMVANSIANRFIRRDEKLVKESDRLR